jgi:hypothetical protein
MHSRVWLCLLAAAFTLSTLWTCMSRHRRPGFSDSPPSVSQPPFRPDTVVCGSKLCQLGLEGCCRSGDEQVCAPLQNIPANYRSMVRASQWPDCALGGLRGDPDTVSLCDDSGDCATGSWLALRKLPAA